MNTIDPQPSLVSSISYETILKNIEDVVQQNKELVQTIIEVLSFTPAKQNEYEAPIIGSGYQPKLISDRLANSCKKIQITNEELNHIVAQLQFTIGENLKLY